MNDDEWVYLYPFYKAEVNIANRILELEENTKIMILSPIIRGEKGSQKDTFDKLRKEGYIRVKVDGELKDLSEDIELDKNKKHNIYAVIDRLIIKDGIRSRLYSSLETGVNLGNGKVVIDIIGGEEILLSEKYACPYCDYSLEELEPRIFSFNAPYGSCEDCKGLGVKYKIDVDLVIPDRNKSILDGAIKALSPSSARTGSTTSSIRATAARARRSARPRRTSSRRICTIRSQSTTAPRSTSCSI